MEWNNGWSFKNKGKSRDFVTLVETEAEATQRYPKEVVVSTNDRLCSVYHAAPMYAERRLRGVHACMHACLFF